MSAFDKSVCEWLSSASINRESKYEILERVKSAIDEYRKLEERGRHSSNNKKNSSSGTTCKSGAGATPLGSKATSRSSIIKNDKRLVDYSFTDVVNDALHQLDLQESLTPPRSPLSERQSDDTNESPALNIVTHTYVQPNNADEEIVLESQLAHQDETESYIGECQSESKQNGFASNDSEVIQDRLVTFKFGRAESESEASSPVMERSDSSVSTTTSRNCEEVLTEGEDTRLRLLQMKRSSRPAVSALCIDADEIMSAEFLPTPKSNADYAFITKLMESHFLFSFLDDADISKLTMVMEMEDIPAGTIIINKGESGDTFYLILSGEVKMTVYDEESEGEEEEEEEGKEREHTKTIDLKRGAVFGELELMYPVKSEVTVEAVTPMVCATMKRNTYKIIISRSAEEKRRRYISFLEKVPFLKSLTPSARSKMAEALKDGRFSQGDKIIQYGEKGEWLHIIVEGTADVIGRNDAGEEEYVVTFHEGDCAGELEFLFHHETVADVVASSPIVKTAKLSQRHFEKLIGTARELLQQNAEEDASYQYYRRTMGSASPPREDLAPPFDEPPEYLAKSKLQLEY